MAPESKLPIDAQSGHYLDVAFLNCNLLRSFFNQNMFYRLEIRDREETLPKLVLNFRLQPVQNVINSPGRLTRENCRNSQSRSVYKRL